MTLEIKRFSPIFTSGGRKLNFIGKQSVPQKFFHFLWFIKSKGVFYEENNVCSYVGPCCYGIADYVCTGHTRAEES
jgi:hypothetical protein